MNDRAEIQTKTVEAKGIKFSVLEAEAEIARAYLYIMHNDLHSEPFALLEDVYVAQSQRGKGLGTQIVGQAIAKARELGCYKLIATSRKSRPKVHQLYLKLGFEEHGLEFRFNL